jgi:thiamine biosynthesis lipoprotein
MAGPRPSPAQTIHRTRALGCRAEILVTEAGCLVGAIEILADEVDRIDRAASRFRDDSEIQRVGRAGGEVVVVSTYLCEVVSVALRVAAATDGAVDPTVGGAMARLGYDRDFAEIAGTTPGTPDTPGRPGHLPDPRPVPGWQSIDLNPDAKTLRVPPGVMLDLGASAKALTADRIAARVHHEFGCGVLVSLGGDVSVAGDPPAGGFRIGLADVSGDANAPETVAITSGGLATSGISARSWTLGEHQVHHIVDPATGLPAGPAWRTVTVAAASCVDANAASTAAMVKGHSAIAWLQHLGLPARCVDLEGGIVRVAAWPDRR